ncbi:MAG: hypothetical protein M1830_002729 [Pleopsidium flavum]|nr:MAG: hypothetical protein M1830_002729 [Pleopsidium flavum]
MGCLQSKASSAPNNTQSAEQPKPKKKGNTRDRRLSHVLPADFQDVSNHPQYSSNVAMLTQMGLEPKHKVANQDRGSIHENFMVQGQTFLMVLDGHGPNGHLCSHFVMETLAEDIQQLLSADPSQDIQTVLQSSIGRVDLQLHDTTIYTRFSGTTLTVCLINGCLLTTAWCGDSRVILGRKVSDGTYLAEDLSIDHKPNLPNEMKRIHAAGGEVRQMIDPIDGDVGPYRVWVKGKEYPGLAMARNGAGDDVAKAVGVVSHAETVQHTVAPGDLVILASDGVWEFMSSADVVHLASQYQSLDEAVAAVVHETRKRWIDEEDGVTDDITAVIMRIPG